jgi:serine phosphatase RsbU (regulator of sigma subunit)/anti-sigma regulatory factor (Ser/Thr protein kinase)
MGEVARRLRLPNELASVGVASEWIRSLGAELGLSSEDVYRLDLCAGELLANIVSYAYSDRARHEIDLRARVNERTVTLEIADDGRPFDPVAWQAPAAAALLAEAPIGGLGLRLVRQFVDESRYARRGDRNVLSVVLHRQGDRENGPQRLRGPERRRHEGAVDFPLQRADGTHTEADARRGLDRRLLGFIAQVELFRDVPLHLVEPVIAGCRIMRLADGQVLLSPGERNEAVALVLSGRLRVHLDAPDSPNFFAIRAGELTGELSVVDGQPVSAYVVADSGCRVLVVGAETLFERLLAIPEVNRNFLRTLAGRVRRTGERVVDQIKSELELEQLQRDMRFAHEIQAGMLPQESPLFPDHAELDCAATLRAARQVGGDFYDAFFVDSSRVFVIIGDVCGKGMPAALFMVRVVTLLRSEAGRRPGARRAYVQRVVDRVNRLLFERNDASLFVSLFCAVLDTSTGLLAYVNAGHNRPAVALADGKFAFVAGPRNPIAGVADGLSYQGGEVVLPAGSALVLYTDGVIDARAAAGEAFGSERLLSTLDGVVDRSAAALIDSLVLAVDAFTGTAVQTDDIALLALAYRGPALA